MTLPLDIYPRVLLVLDYISQGKLQSHACDLAGISVAAFKNALRAQPELQALNVDAEQRGYDRLAENLVRLDQLDETDPKLVKVVCDNIKWLLSRRRPKDYGDRVEVVHNVTADKAIIDALERGRQRAITAKVVEGVVIDNATGEVVHALVSDDEDLSQFL